MWDLAHFVAVTRPGYSGPEGAHLPEGKVDTLGDSRAGDLLDRRAAPRRARRAGLVPGARRRGPVHRQTRSVPAAVGVAGAGFRRCERYQRGLGRRLSGPLSHVGAHVRLQVQSTSAKHTFGDTVSAILTGKPDKNLILRHGAYPPQAGCGRGRATRHRCPGNHGLRLRQRRDVRALHRIGARRGRVRAAEAMPTQSTSRSWNSSS